MPFEIPEYRLRHLVDALGDRYAFEAALGRGAFAAVYRVKNLRLERQEAIKVMAETYDGDNEFAQRFASESKLVASLDHPNIVQVYDHGQIDGILWYSMQYVDGPTLRAELRNRQRFKDQEAAMVGIPLLDALDYSHGQGTIHRDIKPSNILLNKRGRPFVMDFGIAKSVRGTAHTMTGSVLGTPAYIAPEQAQSRNLDGRADVYSMGTMLYELVAGHPPFQGTDMLQVLLRRLNEDPEPLSLQVPGVDPVFEEIIHRSLVREPEDRFEAAEMRDRLRSWLGRGNEDLRVAISSTGPPQESLEDSKIVVDDPSEAMTRQVARIERGETSKMARVEEPAPEPEPSASKSNSRIVPILAAVFLASLLALWFLRPASTPEVTDPPAEPDSTSLTGTQDGASTDSVSGEQTIPSGEPGTLSGVEDSSESSDPDPAQEAPPEAEEAQDRSRDGATVEEASGHPADTAAATRDDSTAAPSTPPPSSPPPPRPQPPPPEPPVIRRPVKPPQMKSPPVPDARGELAVQCAGRSVVLSLRVDEEGKVENARTLRSEVKACEAPALEAARKTLFEPALDLEGLPVAATTTIQLRFEENPP